MPFTYDVSTTLGRIRIEAADTVVSASKFDDDELLYFYSEEGNSIRKAAAHALEVQAQRYAQKASFSADGLSVQWAQSAQECRAQAKELRKRAGGASKTVHMTRHDGYSSDVTAGS